MYEQRSHGRRAAKGTLEFLSPVVRERFVSAAVQHSGQSCRRKICGGECAGGGRKFLRGDADLYRVCVWLQYRLFGDHFPVFWGEGFWKDEDGGDDHADRLRCFMWIFDAVRTGGKREAAADDPHAGGNFK